MTKFKNQKTGQMSHLNHPDGNIFLEVMLLWMVMVILVKIYMFMVIQILMVLQFEL